MKSKTLQKWMAILGLFVLFALVLAPSARAFEGRGGDAVVIPAGETINDDLYVGAGEFTLDGVINGDLVVAGGVITINGKVNGDLMAAGQSVIINGEVVDDARFGGAAITLNENAKVGDDIIAAGYSLETKAGSSVGGDLIFAGGQAKHAGEVGGNLDVATGGLELLGSVGGNVEAEVGGEEDAMPFSPLAFMPNAPVVPSVPPGLTVAESAKIGGDLKYTSHAVASLPEGVVSGSVDRQEPTVDEQQAPEEVTAPFSAGWFLKHLRTLVTLVIVGLLMAWLIPNFVAQGSETVHSQPLHSLGWGVVTVFAVFFGVLVLIAVVILLAFILGVITLSGLSGTIVWIGILAMFILLFAFSLAVAYVSKILLSYLGGRLILARLMPDRADNRYWCMAAGLVVFVILAAIPFLGGLISLLVVLFGLGALWIMGRDWLQSQRAGAPAQVAAS